jgi:hypothetical protein
MNVNTHRRTFRGNGGPTDSRLPKHSARRRAKAPTRPSSSSSSSSADGLEAGDLVEETPWEIVVPVEIQQDVLELLQEEEDEAVLEASSSAEEKEEVVQREESELASEEVQVAAVPHPALKELQHLRKRVQNVQESLQLSDGINDPTTYQNNVLNAVSNCVNEWRSIVNHHLDDLEDDDTDKKATSLAVFQLIQYSLQSGPLAGANPGYFKRCGSQVAKVVWEYLDRIVPAHPELATCMGFTTKQMDALHQWKKKAQTAAEQDKPPSKSALKKQQGKTKPKPKKNKK